MEDFKLFVKKFGEPLTPLYKTILPSSIVKDFERGWGNGYVIIPEDHFLHGKDYHEINKLGIRVHGGLTFSMLVNDQLISEWKEVDESTKGGWIVGFDTHHYGDNKENWTMSRVIEETRKLKKQLIELKPPNPTKEYKKYLNQLKKVNQK